MRPIPRGIRALRKTGLLAQQRHRYAQCTSQQSTDDDYPSFISSLQVNHPPRYWSSIAKCQAGRPSQVFDVCRRGSSPLKNGDWPVAEFARIQRAVESSLNSGEFSYGHTAGRCPRVPVPYFQQAVRSERHHASSFSHTPRHFDKKNPSRFLFASSPVTVGEFWPDLGALPRGALWAPRHFQGISPMSQGLDRG